MSNIQKIKISLINEQNDDVISCEIDIDLYNKSNIKELLLNKSLKEIYNIYKNDTNRKDKFKLTTSKKR